MRVPSRRAFIGLGRTAAAAVAAACAPTPPAPTQKPAESAKPATADAKPTDAKPAAAAPAQAATQSVTLKMQSGFGATDLFHLTLVNWAKKVDEMSGGRLEVDVLASGAVVGPFQMIDAVHQGVLDGALG